MRKVKCIFMPQWELEEILDNIFEKEIEFDAIEQENWFFYDSAADDYIPTDEVFERLAKELDVGRITSMHINACYDDNGHNELWIAYKDKGE